MLKVIRYSDDAFIPQEQTEHMKNVNYHLYEYNEKDIPEGWTKTNNAMKVLMNNIHEEHVKFFTEHLEDLKSGIWVFLDGYVNDHELNHLERKVLCWEAELPEDTECYDANWEKFGKLGDDNMQPYIKSGGCYIPKRELYKLQHVRQKKIIKMEE